MLEQNFFLLQPILSRSSSHLRDDPRQECGQKLVFWSSLEGGGGGDCQFIFARECRKTSSRFKSCAASYSSYSLLLPTSSFGHTTKLSKVPLSLSLSLAKRTRFRLHTLYVFGKKYHDFTPLYLSVYSLRFFLLLLYIGTSPCLSLSLRAISAPSPAIEPRASPSSSILFTSPAAVSRNCAKEGKGGRERACRSCNFRCCCSSLSLQQNWSAKVTD